jgi:hypothetical protein
VADVRYRPWVIEALEQHGLRPLPTTSPGMLRELLNDLYRLELRRLRSDLVAEERRTGRKLRSAYSVRVVELRRRYPLLSQPIETWTEDP